jgi:hypothetical protein
MKFNRYKIFPLFINIYLTLQLITNFIGLYEFKPSDAFFTKFATEICQDHSILQPICMNAIFIITGFNWDQFDTVSFLFKYILLKYVLI